MSKITKVVTVKKGEEKERAQEIADFYNEQRTLGNRVSRANISAAGDAAMVTIYAEKGVTSSADVTKHCAIITVERGNEQIGAAEISRFYNEQNALGSRTSKAISVTVGEDVMYFVFADYMKPNDEDNTEDDEEDDTENDAEGNDPTAQLSDSEDDFDYFS